MYKIFKEYEDAIYDLESNGDLEECVKKCKEVLNDIPNHKNKCDKITYNNMLWYCHYRMAKCYKYMPNKILYAFESLKKSFKYCNISGENYIRTIWMTASCHQAQNQVDFAFKMYKQCEAYFIETEHEFFQAIMLYNKVSLFDNIKDIENAVYKLEKIGYDEYFINGYKKESVINEIYSKLFEVYLNTNDKSYYEKSWMILHKISNKKILKKLQDKFNAKMCLQFEAV